MNANPASHWIFLRGLVRESAHWDDFPQRFRAAVPGATVHLIDLPGNGQHWRQASPLSVPETMEAVRAEALEHLADQDKPAYLFAISLGAMLAVEWAQTYPQELAGAVLVNTSLRGLSPLHERLSCAAWPLLARILTAGDVAERERLILKLTSALPPRPGLIASRAEIHRRHPVRLANVFRQLYAAARHRPSPAKPPIPLLLLGSQGDAMVSPACTLAIARHWNLEPKIHPWAGHDLPLDDPDWVAAAAGEWLT